MTTTNSLAAAALLLLLPLTTTATPLTYAGPDPSQITIGASSFSGNGCPQGTVSTSFSSDKTVVTFGFDSFQTYIGPGTAVADHSKNCQLHLTLNYPGGFQYALVDSTYHGYAQMDTGVKGTFYSTYYFSQDASATTTTQTSLTGGGIWAAGQVYTKEVWFVVIVVAAVVTFQTFLLPKSLQPFHVPKTNTRAPKMLIPRTDKTTG